GAMRAHGHLKTNKGYIFLILIASLAIYFDLIKGSILSSEFFSQSFGPVSLLLVIQLCFLIWFVINVKNGLSYYLLVSLVVLLLIAADQFVANGLIPVMFLMVIIKYVFSGTSVSMDSLTWPIGLLFVFVGLSFLSPFILSTLASIDIGTASASPDGMADDGSTASGSSSTSSAISGISDFWCAIAPIFCDTAAETSDDDGTGDGTSDGTVNPVDLALAVPLKTVSTRVDDLASSGEFNWKIKNDGLKSIDSVLFLMDGSQIQDNHSGEIYDLATGYDSFSDRIEYSGVDIDGGLFYKQLGLISRGGDNNIKVKFDSPQCSLTQFKAPVYLLYTYEIDYNIMLTLVGKNWSDKLDEQGVPLDVNVTESVSTVGPFSVSIYPDEMKQPVVIAKDDDFTIYIKLVKNHPGRAAMSSFEIDVSPILLPQDLDTTRCSFAKAPSDPSSNLDSYVLRDILYDQINNVDLLLNNGLNKEIVYKCSFKYDPANFDKDLIDRTQQRYIGVHIEYTYIYDGLFILNTGNFTDIDSC
ncbi:MAG: hypothetical protein KAI18_01250, partial [Candidatus Aenigmarchaeota archaeon]|nr:hypothetical protein [Candidatus Aenigmarchaeota archaeon]